MCSLEFFEMLCRIKILIPAAFFTLSDCCRKFKDSFFILFKHTKTGANNLACVIVAARLNSCGDKVLKIRAQCNRCCFHNYTYLHKITNIW